MSGTGHRADILIGGIPISVHTSSEAFARMLELRYAGYLGAPGAAPCELHVELTPEPAEEAPDVDLRVYREDERWHMDRGDFRAEWDPATRRGSVRQTANPYSIDSVLRIVHTLALAPQGGFLMHAASAVRNGRAYLFAGASGAGKTTLARLAPPDVDLLSDEISYVRREGDGYVAYGTPFAGELGRPGENVRAPLETIYLLRHGARNHAEPVSGGEAIRSVLANILFFAEDPELVRAVFDAAFALVDRVPVFRLTFRPDREAWDLIGHTPETRQ